MRLHASSADDGDSQFSEFTFDLYRNVLNLPVRPDDLMKNLNVLALRKRLLMRGVSSDRLRSGRHLRTRGSRRLQMNDLRTSLAKQLNPGGHLNLPLQLHFSILGSSKPRENRLKLFSLTSHNPVNKSIKL